MAGRPKTIDEYLAVLSPDKGAALRKLRRIIRAAAPKAEERISYQLAAFRLDGSMLVAFGATENHCAFYLMSSSTVAAYKDELKKYDTSKGTIRFPPDKPLPAALVLERLVEVDQERALLLRQRLDRSVDGRDPLVAAGIDGGIGGDQRGDERQRSRGLHALQDQAQVGDGGTGGGAV